MIKSFYNHNKDLSDCHDLYTEQINEITLSSNYDKILQTFNKITTYPFGINAFKVCESEVMTVKITQNHITKI